MANKCKWTGASGTEYMYEMYPIKGTTWNNVPGNYIFARESKPNNWEPIYIGQTESFKDRIPDHDKLPCVQRNNGTHVHVHVNHNTEARLAEEKDLLASCTTPCNDQN